MRNPLSDQRWLFNVSHYGRGLITKTTDCMSGAN